MDQLDALANDIRNLKSKSERSLDMYSTSPSPPTFKGTRSTESLGSVEKPFKGTRSMETLSSVRTDLLPGQRIALREQLAEARNSPKDEENHEYYYAFQTKGDYIEPETEYAESTYASMPSYREDSEEDAVSLSSHNFEMSRNHSVMSDVIGISSPVSQPAASPAASPALSKSPSNATISDDTKRLMRLKMAEQKALEAEKRAKDAEKRAAELELRAKQIEEDAHRKIHEAEARMKAEKEQKEQETKVKLEQEAAARAARPADPTRSPWKALPKIAEREKKPEPIYQPEARAPAPVVQTFAAPKATPLVDDGEQLQSSLVDDSGKCATCAAEVKGKGISAGGLRFHVHHFTCSKCGSMLGVCKFYKKDGLNYCAKDYERLYKGKKVA